MNLRSRSGSGFLEDGNLDRDLDHALYQGLDLVFYTLAGLSSKGKCHEVPVFMHLCLYMFMWFCVCLVCVFMCPFVCRFALLCFFCVFVCLFVLMSFLFLFSFVNAYVFSFSYVYLQVLCISCVCFNICL